MKTRLSKYSFAVSIHSEVSTISQRLRLIPTRLHRRILTSPVVFYCVKRSLHKCSFTPRHIGHIHTSNACFKLVEALLQVHFCVFSHYTKIRGFPLSAVTISVVRRDGPGGL